MKGLLLEIADAVQHAVEAFQGDPAEVVGRGADGAPSTRIDRLAEETVLRVLDYEGAALNVRAKRPASSTEEGRRSSSSIRSTERTTPSAGYRRTRSPLPSDTSGFRTFRRPSSGTSSPVRHTMRRRGAGRS